MLEEPVELAKLVVDRLLRILEVRLSAPLVSEFAPSPLVRSPQRLLVLALAGTPAPPASPGKAEEGVAGMLLGAKAPESPLATEASATALKETFVSLRL